MIKLIRAFRVNENAVNVMYYSPDLNSEFVVQWNNIHPSTGEVGDYDLQIYCLGNNELDIERVENAIREGESDDNPDLELYLDIRDTFDSLNCEECA